MVICPSIWPLLCLLVQEQWFPSKDSGAGYTIKAAWLPIKLISITAPCNSPILMFYVCYVKPQGQSPHLSLTKMKIFNRPFIPLAYVPLI